MQVVAAAGEALIVATKIEGGEVVKGSVVDLGVYNK